MNLIEIIKDKFAPLIKMQKFKIINSKIHSMHETITLVSNKTGLIINKDCRESYTYVVFFVLKSDGEPDSLNIDCQVNLSFYLQEILTCQILIDKYESLSCRAEELLTLCYHIVSKDIDKFTKPNMEEIRLAIERQKRFMIKSEAEFEQSIRDELKDKGVEYFDPLKGKEIKFFDP